MRLQGSLIAGTRRIIFFGDVVDVILREGGRGLKTSRGLMTLISTHILLQLRNSQRAKQLERTDAKSTSEKLRRKVERNSFQGI